MRRKINDENNDINHSYYKSCLEYFSPLFGHWDQFLMNMGYFATYLATFHWLFDHDFLTFTPPGANFLRIWYIFKPIWLLVTKLRQLQILVAIAKAYIIHHFGGFWGIE